MPCCWGWAYKKLKLTIVSAKGNQSALILVFNCKTDIYKVVKAFIHLSSVLQILVKHPVAKYWEGRIRLHTTAFSQNKDQ